MAQVESPTLSIVPANVKLEHGPHVWLSGDRDTAPLVYQPSPGTTGTTGTHWPPSPAAAPHLLLLPNFARCSPGHHPGHHTSYFYTTLLLGQLCMKGGTICPFSHVAWQFVKMSPNGDGEQSNRDRWFFFCIYSMTARVRSAPQSLYNLWPCLEIIISAGQWKARWLPGPRL